MANPYLTSDDLVATVQRKISMPLTQNTFSYDDILAFCNDEMFTAQVPTIMTYHEEYFVFRDAVAIVPGQERYAIPTRAIGMKLRDVKWQDSNGNLFDMSRVNPEDKAFYQVNIGTSQTISKYYIEGNDLVLLPALTLTNSVTMFFYYFLRPNQLVANSRAAIMTSFANQIITLNSSIAPMDTVTIGTTVFTAVAASPTGTQFLIGVDDIQTATNLVNTINMSGVAQASNNIPASATITLLFPTLAASQLVTTSNTTGFIIPIDKQLIQFNQVPSTYQNPNTFVITPLFVNGTTIDFLQTNPGHRTYSFDVTIPPAGIAGNIIAFNLEDVPTNMIIGDYICVSNECIIPQIPPDLHNELAQRAASMILSALGDQAGLQASMAKVQEMEKKQITLLDARVEGSPLKIAPKKSLLRYQSASGRRRRY